MMQGPLVPAWFAQTSRPAWVAWCAQSALPEWFDEGKHRLYVIDGGVFFPWSPLYQGTSIGNIERRRAREI